MATKEIGLGVIFTGRVDSAFNQAIAKLKSAILELGNIQTQLQKQAQAASAQSQALSGDMSAQSSAISNLTGKTQAYKDALQSLEAQHGKGTAAFKESKAILDQVEKSVQRVGLSMSNAGLDGQKFANETNRLDVVSKVLNQDLKATATGFKEMSTAGKDFLGSIGVTQLTELQKAQRKFVDEAPQFQSALSQLSVHAQNNKTSFSELTNQLSKAEKWIQNNAIAMEQAGWAGKTWSEKVDRAGFATRLFSNDLTVTGDKLKALTPEGTRFASQMGIMAQQAEKSAVSVKNVGAAATGMHSEVAMATGALDRLSRAFKVIAAYGAAGTIVGAVTMGFGQAVASIRDFDQALKSIQAITQATDAEIVVMGKEMLELSKTTKYSAKEIGDGMILLGQAGLSAAESLNAIKATAILATGTMSSLEATSDLLTTSLMAYGINASQAGRVADVMANAMNKSKLDVDKLRVAFNYVAASAAEAGLSLEQTAASMMVLSNAGLRASTIGTGLRQVLSKLISPNDKLREAYKEQGIAMDSINPATVGWATALANLSKVLWDHTKGVVDMGKAYQIFELRGAQAAAVLVKAFQTGDYEKMLAYVFNVGSAEEMAAKQAEGLGIKLAQLGNQAKNVAIGFGDTGLVGSFKMLVDVLRDALSGIEYFITSGIGQFTIQVAIMTASIFGIVKVLEILSTAMKSTASISFFLAGVQQATSLSMVASTAVTALGAAFKGLVAFLTGPIGIIAAIASVVVGLKWLADANDRYIKQLGEEIVKNNEAQTSLIGYSSSLTKLDEQMKAGANVKIEYIGLVQRLIKDHPELRKQIDLTKVTYEGFHKELDAAIKKTMLLQGKQGAKDYASSLLAQQNKIAQLSKNIQNLAGESGDTLVELPLTPKQEAEYKKAISDMEKDTVGYVNMLENLMNSAGLTKEQIEALIRSTAGFTDEGVALSTKVIAEFGDALKRSAAVTKDVGTEIDELSPKFKELAKSIGPENLGEFLVAYKAFKAKIAAVEKTGAQSKLYSPEQVSEGVKKLEDQFIEEWKLKIGKNVQLATAEAKYDNMMASMETDSRDKIIRQYKAREDEINVFREKELKNAKGDEDKKLEIEAKAAILSEQNRKQKAYALNQLDMQEAEAAIKVKESEEKAKLEIEKRAAIQKLNLIEAPPERLGMSDLAVSREAQPEQLGITQDQADESVKIIRDETDQATAIVEGALNKEAELTINTLNLIRDRRQAFYDQTRAMFGDNDKRTKEALQSYVDSSLTAEKAVTDGEQKERDKRMQLAGSEARYKELMAGYKTDRYDKINQDYEAREAQITAFQQREYKIVASNQSAVQDLEKKVGAARAANTAQREYEELQLDMQLAEDAIKLKETEARAKLEIEKRTAGESETYKMEAQKKETEIVANTLKGISDLRKAQYEKALELFGENDQRTIKAHQDYANSILASEKVITDGKEKELNRQYTYNMAMTRKHLDENYRKGKITADQYLAESKRLMDQGALDQEVYADRVASSSGNMLTQISYGIEQSKGQIRTWGEFWVSLGNTMIETVSTKMTDSLMSYIDGTKTAKEAFADFATSTIKWLTEIIIKQQMMALLSKVMPGSSKPSGADITSGEFGLGGGGFDFGSIFSGLTKLFSFHGGGVVGSKTGYRGLVPAFATNFMPRLHGGLRPDEYAAVLQRGETVIPKGTDAQGMTVNINNNAGADVSATQSSDGKSLDIFIERKVAESIRRNPGVVADAWSSEARSGNRDLLSTIRRNS